MEREINKLCILSICFFYGMFENIKYVMMRCRLIRTNNIKIVGSSILFYIIGLMKY